MADTLPRPVQLRLEQTLSQWRHWQCDPPLDERPAVIGPLAGGISNHSLLVGNTNRFVVRIDGVDPKGLGLNRQAEWHAMEAAHSAGLAPRPCYFNPELGSLVCEYLPPDTASNQVPEAIASLLRGIHDLPASHHRLDLWERMQRYERRHSQGEGARLEELQNCRAPVRALLAKLADEPAPMTLCHNDLLAGNRLLSGGTLYALDWEYCAMGDPCYDLAVVACGDELSDRTSGLLLQAYLGRTATEQEWLRLQRYCCVYRYLELAWYLSLDRPGLDRPGLAKPVLEAKLAALEAALGEWA